MDIYKQARSKDEGKRSPAALLIKLGRNVQRCRVYQGISHKRLSDITGIELTHLTLIVLGLQDITLEELAIIASALDVEAKTLLS